MANTYTNIIIHVVFWIRNDYLRDEFIDDVYAYISGALKNKGHKPLAIGGTSNHIHVLVGLNPKQAISDMVKEIKISSYRFIKDKEFIKHRFTWQEGYGGFSYSKSHLDRIVKYIRNQKQHHKKKTFKEEYQEMLKKYGIEFDEKFLL
jgi:putative transposase